MHAFNISAYKQAMFSVEKIIFQICVIYFFLFPSAAITFASGTMLVCVSIYLYGLPKQDTSKVMRTEKEMETELKQKLIPVWVTDSQQRTLSEGLRLFFFCGAAELNEAIEKSHIPQYH